MSSISTDGFVTDAIRLIYLELSTQIQEQV